MQPADQTGLPDNPSARLRQLAHDLRSPLSILSMGVETLKSFRTDPEQFDQICNMLLTDGVEPMKQLINRVAEEAERMKQQ